MNQHERMEAMVRQNHGRLIAALVGKFKDITLAEDVLQEAIVQALAHWKDDQWPSNPPGWLMTVATRKAIDRLRRNTIDQEKIGQLQAQANPVTNGDDQEEIPDHRLKLIFTCCHPSIAADTRSALILKTVCGLSTAQIAHAYLVSESTMAQRLVRAKNKIRKAGIPFELPEQSLASERVNGVLHVIYLIFNAGYQASDGAELIDTALCDEALYLARLVVSLLSGNAEAIGLLALMMFHQARRTARTSAAGDLVVLEEQDRNLWDREEIRVADKLLKGALMKGQPGAYQIQAAISAVHCHATNFGETDWKQIALLYHQLEQHDPNPVIRINQAVALSFAETPDIGLMYLDHLPDLESFSRYHPYYVARADMQARNGQVLAAVDNLRKAIALTGNDVETRYLKRKLDSLQRTTSAP